MLFRDLLKRIKEQPQELMFEDVMVLIDSMYDFHPAMFKNGPIINEAGENNGSCKLLSFGLHHHLTKEQVLHCFGQHYREVVANPDGNSHANIRQFIQTGWDGVSFEGEPLTPKDFV